MESNMKNISAHCFQVGTLQIGTTKVESKGFDITGAYAAYEMSSAQSLHNIAQRYDKVLRPSGARIKGSLYSLKMATNDYNKAQ
jgi:hypothetical protein